MKKLAIALLLALLLCISTAAVASATNSPTWHTLEKMRFGPALVVKDVTVWSADGTTPIATLLASDEPLVFIGFMDGTQPPTVRINPYLGQPKWGEVNNGVANLEDDFGESNFRILFPGGGT